MNIEQYRHVHICKLYGDGDVNDIARYINFIDIIDVSTKASAGCYNYMRVK